MMAAAQQTSNVVKALPTGPSWKIVYRVGTKKREGVFSGKDESEALNTFIKTCGVGYQAIVSSTRMS